MLSPNFNQPVLADRCPVKVYEYMCRCSAGLTLRPLYHGRAPRRQRPPTNCHFTTLFWSLNIEKTFTNHMFCVGLLVTFGLNDRRIHIQYPSWSAKGLIARWVKLLDISIWLLKKTGWENLLNHNNSLADCRIWQKNDRPTWIVGPRKRRKPKNQLWRTEPDWAYLSRNNSAADRSISLKFNTTVRCTSAEIAELLQHL